MSDGFFNLDPSGYKVDWGVDFLANKSWREPTTWINVFVRV